MGRKKGASVETCAGEEAADGCRVESVWLLAKDDATVELADGDESVEGS